MVGTPGKRVTRSRAAATKPADEMNAPAKRSTASKSVTSRRARADLEDINKAEETIAGAAAKRPSHATLKATPTITTARRRIKVTPLDVTASEQRPVADAAPDKPNTKNPKGSSKDKKEPKTVDGKPNDQPQLDETQVVAKPKTRRKAVADKDETNEKKPVAKTRGRPKKNTASELTGELQEQQPMRLTRTRAGSGAPATQATAASTAKATAASRKKVTFQELPESDKENRPLVAKAHSSRGQGAPAAGGLRAKPVRKPTTAKGRATAGITNKGALEELKPIPLSPKKMTQVAKSSPGSSDDDELSGPKTPMRDLSQSPKRNRVLAGMLSPVKKLDFGTNLPANSPEREASGTTLMSPPQRYIPSPFKDALKESPKRGEGAFIFPPSALKVTSATAMSATTSQSQSVLFQSPKRGAIDNSIFIQSAVKPFKSPVKATLMQSPPKRLCPSSKAPGSEAAPAKANSLPSATNETNLDNEPRDIIASSNLRASQSPERSMKVHKITSDEVALGAHPGIDFDESVLDIRSPIKVSRPTKFSLPSTIESGEPLPVFADLSPAKPVPHVLSTSSCHDEADSCSTGAGEPMEGVTAALASEHIQPSSTSAVPSTCQATPSLLFRTAQLEDDEESSEDELQANYVSFRNAHMETPGISGKTTRSRLSTVNPKEMSRNVGFTPLAAQLSSWRTASPDKELNNDSSQRGVFSPLAAQHVPGVVQISRQSTPQRRSVGSRFSKAAASSPDLRITNSVRRSYSPAMADTPEKYSYFADEMAVKDLEYEVEGAQFTHANQDMTSSSIFKDINLPAFVEGAPPELVTDAQISNTDEVALLGDVSDAMEIHHIEKIPPVMIAPGFLSAEAQVEDAVKNTQNASAIEEPVMAADAKLLGSSESMKELEVEVEHQDDETAHQPQCSIEPCNTPFQQSKILPRFVNTIVSKVPLRPEGYISPIKIPKKRSRSLSGGSSSAKKPTFAPSLVPQSNTVVSLSPTRYAKSQGPDTPGQHSFLVDDFGDSTLDDIDIDEDDENLPPLTPCAVAISASVTPGRAPLKPVDNGPLQGAIVFVDVHTTEGADASGIFVELLTQMGARCVRQWNWNPRASTAGCEADAENIAPGGLARKVGITHVVYKDGGKRTLEKVRDAGGVVQCVGVGWVLDCERENSWLDEAQYAVDTSLMPRGGSRRRKSMEPRALINMNGSLSAAKGRRCISAELTPAMKAELMATPVRADLRPSRTSQDEPIIDEDNNSAFGSLNSSFSTPTGIQAGFVASTTSNLNNAADFATPTGHVNYEPGDGMSPTTPYYLSQGAKLVQQTCPPKQTQKGLFDTDAGNRDKRASGLGFPVTGRTEDEPNESVRVRLEAVRRKTMNWRPRVASPLGR